MLFSAYLLIHFRYILGYWLQSNGLINNYNTSLQYSYLQICGQSLNPLRHTKILDWFNFKAFADDIFHLTQNMKSACHRVEKIDCHWVKTLWEKEKMLVTSIFPPFPQYFQKAFFSELLKADIVRCRVKWLICVSVCHSLTCCIYEVLLILFKRQI